MLSKSVPDLITVCSYFWRYFFSKSKILDVKFNCDVPEWIKQEEILSWFFQKSFFKAFLQTYMCIMYIYIYIQTHIYTYIVPIWTSLEKMSKVTIINLILTCYLKVHV
jgi:hypothetical protein